MSKSKVVPKFKVGDVIYVRYKYNVLYLKYFVVGETSRSWCVKIDPTCTWQPATKLPKTLKDFTVGTEQDAKLAGWAATNRWKIGHCVDSLTDCHLLYTIATLIDHPSLSELEGTPYEK